MVGRMSRIKRRSVRRTRSLRKGGKKNGRRMSKRMRGGGCDAIENFKVEKEQNAADMDRTLNHLRGKNPGHFIIRQKVNGDIRLDIKSAFPEHPLIKYRIKFNTQNGKASFVDRATANLFKNITGGGGDETTALHNFACNLHQVSVTVPAVGPNQTKLIYLPEQNNLYDTVAIQGGLTPSLKASFLQAQSENGGEGFYEQPIPSQPITSQQRANRIFPERVPAPAPAPAGVDEDEDSSPYSFLAPGVPRAEAVKPTLEFMKDFTSSTLDKVAFDTTIQSGQGVKGIFERAHPHLVPRDGTFILRKKDLDVNGRRSVVVSMWHDGIISQFDFTVKKVGNEDNYFGTGGTPYGSLTEMLSYFRENPLHFNHPNTKMRFLLYEPRTHE